MRASGSFDLGNHAPLLRVKNSALPADEFTQIITGQGSGEQSPRDAPRRTPQSVTLVLSSDPENLPPSQLVQSEAPAAESVPATQLLQSVALVFASEPENLPAAQSSHVPTLVCAGNSENLPAS